jgi:hypothetical protein
MSQRMLQAAERMRATYTVRSAIRCPSVNVWVIQTMLVLLLYEGDNMGCLDMWQSRGELWEEFAWCRHVDNRDC